MHPGNPTCSSGNAAVGAHQYSKTRLQNSSNSKRPNRAAKIRLPTRPKQRISQSVRESYMLSKCASKTAQTTNIQNRPPEHTSKTARPGNIQKRPGILHARLGMPWWARASPPKKSKHFKCVSQSTQQFFWSPRNNESAKEFIKHMMLRLIIHAQLKSPTKQIEGPRHVYRWIMT